MGMFESRMRSGATSSNGKIVPKPNRKHVVSLIVRFIPVLLCIGFAFLLVGCGAVEAAKEQVGRDTFRPKEPTSPDVVAHVYLDRSGSSKHLRADIGQQLVDLLDFYPEAIEASIYWYSNDVSKIRTTVAGRSTMQEIVDEYENDPHGDDGKSQGTNLALAFRDLEQQCARTPQKQVIGVFVTDGGFEDSAAGLAKEAEALRDIPNAAMIVFLGLSSDGTKKLTLLDNVVRDRFIMGANGELQKQYFDITVRGGEPMMDQAKQAIQMQIDRTRRTASRAESQADNANN